jgi:hypothetical protein
MTTIRERLKDHPIQSILTALASIATIVALFFAIRADSCNQTKSKEPNPKKGNDKLNQASFDISDKGILEFLTLYFNSPETKTTESFYGQSGSLRVKKKVWMLHNFQASYIDKEKYAEKLFYDKLALNGFIATKVLLDTVLATSTEKKFDVTLTEKGREILVGETIDYFYLNAFDFSNLRLIGKEIRNDTFFVKFSIGQIINQTPIYDLITDDFKQRIQKSLMDTIERKLLRYNSQFKVID